LTSSFQIDNVRVGSGDLFLIAGPCVIESEKHALFMAEVIKGVARSLNFPFIFKASYDKANRTSIRSFRGPGLKEGLRILKNVKDEVHIPVLTDVHQVADVAAVAEVVDVLLGHPAVTEVAVTGTPSDEWGEVVTAWVVADGPGPDADSLLAFAAERLAAYKRPRLIRFVEALPRNAMGKVTRSRLG
jgi:non-ribosomal peptide synthetase component E (peptide arylation enzyme)